MLPPAPGIKKACNWIGDATFESGPGRRIWISAKGISSGGAGVGVGVGEGVSVGVGVSEGVGVYVDVGDAVRVGVAVMVGVDVRVGHLVGEAVSVGVDVGLVTVGVSVCVGVISA